MSCKNETAQLNDRLIDTCVGVICNAMSLTSCHENPLFARIPAHIVYSPRIRNNVKFHASCVLVGSLLAGIP